MSIGDQGLVIVVALDLSEASVHTFETALNMLRERGREPLYVVHVTDSAQIGVASGRLSDWVSTELARIAPERGSPRCELLEVSGAPAKEVVRIAGKVDADLVVVGTHGRRGVRRLVLGSVAEEVLRTASCPVLVVRAKDWTASA
jgi:nucleotide-binding universal stress UspA family protein